MLTLITFILVLALLVLAHEFGHFVTARKAGMKVFEFGFGFPPRAFGMQRLTKDLGDGVISKKWRFFWGRGEIRKEEGQEVAIEHLGWETGTIYSFNWLPLGGFVRIKGEDGDCKTDPDSFGYQKAWKRSIVLVSGVVMNFLLAGVLLSAGFMVGLPTDLSTGSDPRAIVIGEARILVQMVEKGSPAYEIGVKFGDQILAINDESIKSSTQMVEFIQNNGDKALTLKIKRGSEELSLDAQPRIVKSGESAPRLGLMLVDAAMVRYPWHWSIIRGFSAAWFGLINIFVAFYVLLKNLILGHGLAMDVSGPVGIAVIIGQSARMGINYLINVTAMISLSLAAINILPIPALDGGRVLFILIEKIIRRPVNKKVEQYAHLVGFALLMLLIVVVTGRDILGLIK